MEEFLKWLKKLLITLFSVRQLSKTAESLDLPPELLNLVQEKAKPVIDIAVDLFDGKSEVEKDYLKYIAIIKATKVEELTLEEIIEHGEVVARCAELGIEVSEEISAFWSAVGSVASGISGYSSRLIARVIVGILP